MLSAASPIDFPGAPAAAGTLLSALNQLLAIEMSIDAELSLVESSGVAEWGGVPINRGLFLNMTCTASGFMGFSFDFGLLALIRLPNPSPSRAMAFGQALMGFFTNPMGVVTGEVDLSAIGLQFGITISANATLPFFPSRLEFFGRITFISFELRASAFFRAGPFLLDVRLEVCLFPNDAPRLITLPEAYSVAVLCCNRYWPVCNSFDLLLRARSTLARSALSLWVARYKPTLLSLRSMAASAGQCLDSPWRAQLLSTVGPGHSRSTCVQILASSVSLSSAEPLGRQGAES